MYDYIDFGNGMYTNKKSLASFGENYKGFYPYGIFVNDKGEWVERNPRYNEYSYDAYMYWRNGKNDESTSAIYSDRLMSWVGYEKLEELSNKYPNSGITGWGKKDPEKIEQILQELYGKDLKLIYIMQCCDVSSGYPLWTYHIKNK